MSQSYYELDNLFNKTEEALDKLTNYKLTKLSCASMFPRTKHIESVCLLERI